MVTIQAYANDWRSCTTSFLGKSIIRFKSRAVGCILAIGALALSACEPTRVLENESGAVAPVVQSVRLASGTLEFTANEFVMQGSGKAKKITPSLRKMLADVAASSAFVDNLEERVKASPTGKLHGQRPSGLIHAAGQRESALGLYRGRDAGSVGPMAPSAAAMYARTDL
ncbi:hypothetical protein [Gemmatimonas sp.]|uniref:hypothetical protein n=1 Tax=Gemmatimonas sp. TaxID=1962908 RepID=UPI003563500E